MSAATEMGRASSWSRTMPPSPSSSATISRPRACAPPSPRTGEEAELQVAEDRFDLIVLDWMLPGLSGIELCRRLRRRDATAQRADPDADRARRGRRPRARPRHRRRRLRGQAVLGAGAGGAREGACCAGRRRTASPTSCAPATSSSTAPRTASPAASGRSAWALPSSSCWPSSWRTPGRVLSRQQLLDGVWGRDAFIDGRTVDVHVGRLRKALIRGSDSDPIRTVRGAGYAFEEHASRAGVIFAARNQSSTQYTSCIGICGDRVTVHPSSPINFASPA